MPVYISGRYWPFIIVFGYTLRDLTVNLLSNDLSIGLDRNSSVIQRIVIYVAMLAVGIICSTVIEFLQKQQCPQREIVTSGRHIVDTLAPETQHADLAHLTFTQPEALSQHITQLHDQAGEVYHTEVPSRSAGITEPEALGQTEDLSQTRVHSLAPRIPEPQALPQNEALLRIEDLLHTGVRSKSLNILTVFPQAGDLPRGEDLSQTEVPSQSPDIPEVQALSQTEDLLLAEELPRTEDQPRHTGDIPELQNLSPPHNSTFHEGSGRRRTRNIIELDGGPGRGKSIISSFLEVKAWTDRQAVELFEIKVIKILERDLSASHQSPDQDPSASPRDPLDPEVAAMFSEDLDY